MGSIWRVNIDLASSKCAFQNRSGFFLELVSIDFEQHRPRIQKSITDVSSIWRPSRSGDLTSLSIWSIWQKILICRSGGLSDLSIWKTVRSDFSSKTCVRFRSGSCFDLGDRRHPKHSSASPVSCGLSKRPFSRTDATRSAGQAIIQTDEPAALAIATPLDNP